MNKIYEDGYYWCYNEGWQIIQITNNKVLQPGVDATIHVDHFYPIRHHKLIKIATPNVNVDVN